MIRRRTDAQDGFALLEVLVATAIAAASLAVIYGLIATSTRSTSVERATTEASILARSILAEVTTGARTGPGEYWSRQGEAPSWRLRLVPAEQPVDIGGVRFQKVELTIWHLGQDKAPLEFETEVLNRDDTGAIQ